MDFLITMVDDTQHLAHHGVQGMKWGVWNDETKAKYGYGTTRGDRLRAKAVKTSNPKRAARLGAEADKADARLDKRLEGLAANLRKRAIPVGEAHVKNEKALAEVYEKYPKFAADEKRILEMYQKYDRAVLEGKTPHVKLEKMYADISNEIERVEKQPGYWDFNDAKQAAQHTNRVGIHKQNMLSTAAEDYVLAAIDNPRLAMRNMGVGSVRGEIDQRDFRYRVQKVMECAVQESIDIVKNGQLAVDDAIDKTLGNKGMYRYLG